MRTLRILLQQKEAMINLTNYQSLISQMPYLEHGVEVNRAIWKGCEEEFPELYHLNVSIFEKKDTIYVNRFDVLNQFNDENYKKFLLFVLYWSFPQGMKGLNFQRVMHRIKLLISDLRECTESQSIEFSIEKLAKFQSLGAQGITSLCYFTGITSEFGLKALILDPSIIAILQKGIIPEFEEIKNIDIENWATYYIPYLKITHKLSTELQVEPDQIEFFLRTFAGRLKPLQNSKSMALVG